MHFMKKLLFLFILSMPLILMAQIENMNPKVEGGMNSNKKTTGIFKASLTSILLKNYHFQYEHALNNKFSVSLSYRFQPKGNIPLSKYIEDQINDPDVKVGDFQMGNNAITPEFRYYFSGKRMKGFYVAAYARIASFELQLPIEYQSGLGNKTTLLNGSLKSTSGGLMFGSQFNLGKSLVLDWWILGGHYGSASGDLVSTFGTPLTPTEQSELKNSLNNVELGLVKTTNEVTANYAKLSASGPWAGVRAFGLSLGFKF
jgi:hypothetical protein